MHPSIFLLLKKLFLLLIRLYQRTLSPDHGLLAYKYPMGYCKFNPTCSQYTYQVIERWGLIRGGLKAVRRIIRCNPFSRRGYDSIDTK